MALTLIGTISVPVKPPKSVTCTVKLPAVAVHDAAMFAVTVPLVLVSAVVLTPTVLSATIATVKLPAGSVKSLTVPKVASVAELPC